MAERLAAAGLAERAHPDGIELRDGCGHQLRIVRPDARLEVALAVALHADPRAGQIRGADIGRLHIDDQQLEMHPRAQHAFQACRENGVAIEISPEIGSGLLGVDQADAHALFDQLGVVSLVADVADRGWGRRRHGPTLARRAPEGNPSEFRQDEQDGSGFTGWSR